MRQNPLTLTVWVSSQTPAQFSFPAGILLTKLPRTRSRISLLESGMGMEKEKRTGKQTGLPQSRTRVSRTSWNFAVESHELKGLARNVGVLMLRDSITSSMSSLKKDQSTSVLSTRPSVPNMSPLDSEYYKNTFRWSIH
jgi:hypothetical protein